MEETPSLFRYCEGFVLSQYKSFTSEAEVHATVALARDACGGIQSVECEIHGNYYVGGHVPEHRVFY